MSLVRDPSGDCPAGIPGISTAPERISGLSALRNPESPLPPSARIIGDLSLKDIQGGATALTLRDVSAWLLVRCHCRNARLAIRLLWAVLFAAVREAIGSPAWLPGVNTAAKIHS